MALRAATSAALIGAAAGTINLSISDCGDSSTHGHVSGISPSSVPQGTKTKVSGSGSLDTTAADGSFDVVVKAAGVTVQTCKGDLCSASSCALPANTGSVDFRGVSCPLAAGDVTLDFDVSVSKFVPSSLATLEIDITSEGSAGKLLCAKINTSPGLESPATLEEMADHINSQNLSWKAEAPKKFGDFDDVKMLCGTIMNDEETFVPQATQKEDDGENVDIPTDFDVRTNWPDCAVVSGHIRDQSACGSCWAFGSTEAFNDRRCIATGETTLLSTTDTAANCGFLQCFSMGCNGGQPGKAWDWFVSHGVVTGGDYEDVGKGTTCGPYPFPSCAHHVPATDAHPECPSNEYSTPTLRKCSEDGYGVDYKSDKVKAATSYSLKGVENIQKDIMQYGTVTAAFTVYEDFPTYKSGVYRHASGRALGGHAIKILGWGVEDGQDYWLVANSWNDSWGNGGTFKIVRGENHCGIEGQVSAGHAVAAEVTV